MKLGPLWTAARIDVDDGQYENYMDWLMKVWADNQAFAKSQGWILDYHILDSVNPRDGEPDLILITRFADFPSAARNRPAQRDHERADEAGRSQRGRRERQAK